MSEEDGFADSGPAVELSDDHKIKLSDEQEKAVSTIVSSDKLVTVLTGAAGAGKSTVVNELKKRMSVKIAATTGRAALHIGGTTVDRLFCFSRSSWGITSYDRLEKTMFECADLIIIDEASMMGANMGTLIYDVIKKYKKRVVLVGDWAQASPVKEGWLLNSQMLRDYEFIKLEENHRQEDGPYLDALNKLRYGIVDASVNELFATREAAKPPQGEEGDKYIRMYATNKRADRYNEFRVFKHSIENKQPIFRMWATFEDLRDARNAKRWPRDESFKRKAIEDSSFDHGAKVAIGVRAIITRNSGPTMAYANGDTGVVVGGMTTHGIELSVALERFAESGHQFHVDSLNVKLDRTDSVVRVCQQAQVVYDAFGSEQHSITGVPVRLGYAITIHKAQGCTVDKAWVDLESIADIQYHGTGHGLAYVALSRTRTLEGLLVNKWRPDVVRCDPEIQCLL